MKGEIHTFYIPFHTFPFHFSSAPVLQGLSSGYFKKKKHCPIKLKSGSSEIWGDKVSLLHNKAHGETKITEEKTITKVPTEQKSDREVTHGVFHFRDKHCSSFSQTNALIKRSNNLRPTHRRCLRYRVFISTPRLCVKVHQSRQHTRQTSSRPKLKTRESHDASCATSFQQASLPLTSEQQASSSEKEFFR